MTTPILNILFLAGSFLLAGVLGMIIIPNILFVSYKKQLFDVPDERKVHHTPIPRLGGLSFTPVILITLFLSIGLRVILGTPIDSLMSEQSIRDTLFIFSGLMLLYLVGEMDDLVGVGYRAKFLIQILSAVMMILSGNWLHSLGGLFGIYELPAWIGMPLSVVVIIYITNAINLIDGIDGLASGLCCIALAVLSGMLLFNGDYVYALLAMVTLGVVVPFWFYNVFGNARRGHKLFMGDAGSLTLGYLLSFIVMHLSLETSRENGNEAMIMAFTTLLVPMLDVARVVIHRLRKHRNPFLPDRNHLHHKLLRTGMKPSSVLISILGIVVLFIVMNAILSHFMNITILLCLDVAVWTGLQLLINHRIIYPQFPSSPVTSKSELLKTVKKQ